MNSTKSSGIRKPGQSNFDKILFLAFGIAFVSRLFSRLMNSLGKLGVNFNFSRDAEISEWMINYQGGYVRRGLPGSVLHAIHSLAGIGPSAIAVSLSIVVYVAFAIYIFRKSSGIAPYWVLLTPPFLGYPVYMHLVLGRKDIFILLLFAISVSRAFRHVLNSWDLVLISTLMTVGILSHEVLGFFGLPSLACILLLRNLNNFSMSRLYRRSIALLFPFVALVLSLVYHGSQATSMRIHNSWKSAISPELLTSGPDGSIWWIGASSEYGRQIAKGMLNSLHNGIPTWIILVLSSISLVTLTFLLLLRYSPSHSAFYVIVSAVQFLSMIPVFMVALDSGRWICLSALSAWIVTIESTTASRDSVSKFLCSLPFPRVRCKLPSPMHKWLLPLGFSLWGIPLYGWAGLTGWLQSCPMGILATIYFHLRILGLPRPVNIFNFN